MHWSVDDYVKNAFFVSQYGEKSFMILNLVSDENILDLGCVNAEIAAKISLKGGKGEAIDSKKNDLCSSKT